MPQIQVDQIIHIVWILYEIDQEEVLMDEHDLTDEEVVNVLKQGSKRTGKGYQFTRRQLMQRSDWEG